MTTNPVLFWFKEFKYSWLPQNIPTNTRLFGLITNKLRELEHLLTESNHGENESSSASENHCDNSSDAAQVILSTIQTSEHFLPTPPDLQNHDDDELEHPEKFYRPAIRLKRISLAEAERFVPDVWKPTKAKRGRKKGQKKLTNGNKTKKNTQRNEELSSSIQHETANNVRKSTRSKINTSTQSKSSLINIQSTPGEKKKGRRKLRAINAEDDDLVTLGNLSQINHTNGETDCDQVSRYIGQNGILSQTRKNNETTTIIDDDFTTKLASSISNEDETLISNFSEYSNGMNMNPIPNTSSIVDPMNILEDVCAIGEVPIFDDTIENNDNESLFTTLDKTPETSSMLNNNSIINYNDCIEDISNDGIEPPPSTSSPNLGHFPLIT